MYALLKTLSFIVGHPLNQGRPLAALSRYIKWQIGSRLVPGRVAVPFAGDARLLVSPGMTGATQNIYTGLHEFEDMGFVLHCLRPDDLFVDVGANIGSYTILAASVTKAFVIAAEPIPVTFQSLLQNVYLNNIANRVTAKRVGIASAEQIVRMSSARDTTNHVLAKSEHAADSLEVPMITLDALVGAGEPVILKIDVEGFETEVIASGSVVLERPSLVAVIMELNGSGSRYGFSEAELHKKMISFGFLPYCYFPFTRKLEESPSKSSTNGNTLYLRNIAFVEERVRNAPRRYTWSEFIRREWLVVEFEGCIP